ncbi:uncharacterized protein CC84DRAFT_1154685, partial [Paraphaeosphaeria sporulosa]
DCVIEYTLPSVDLIDVILGDPDWAETRADQRDWVDVDKALLTFGFCTKYVDQGKVVERAQSRRWSTT